MALKELSGTKMTMNQGTMLLAAALTAMTILALGMTVEGSRGEPALLLRSETATWKIHYASHGGHRYFVFNVRAFLIYAP